ncbi:hypothetical protein HMPREF3227_01351 [Corynebacterium sp. CMW7794]|nr:hypothetical protein HMPREF3227_01351 [Corynebacterium sp. CMW7794]
MPQIPRPRNPHGSSPLTRGALRIFGERDRCGGLIPAHAGSTALSGVMLGIGGAHPRSRGEHQVLDTINPGRWGSSPLTRGARSQLRAVLPWPRLIPAHAGSTARPFSVQAGGKAHPRSRGEHT